MPCCTQVKHQTPGSLRVSYKCIRLCVHVCVHVQIACVHTCCLCMLEFRALCSWLMGSWKYSWSWNSSPTFLTHNIPFSGFIWTTSCAFPFCCARFHLQPYIRNVKNCWLQTLWHSVMSFYHARTVPHSWQWVSGADHWKWYKGCIFAQWKG